MFIIVVDINRHGGDFVITYSLDNYITIKGIINDNEIVDYKGYLINPNNITGSISNNDLKYRGIDIENESLSERLMEKDGSTNSYIYNKISGIKYYKANDGNYWFSLNNSGDRLPSETFKDNSDAAQRYYEEARDFTNTVLEKFGTLNTKDAVDKDGNNVAKQNGWRRV